VVDSRKQKMIERKPCR